MRSKIALAISINLFVPREHAVALKGWVSWCKDQGGFFAGVFSRRSSLDDRGGMGGSKEEEDS